MYEFHLFVCVNERDNPKMGCRDRQSFDLLVKLRETIKEKKLPALCRVNKSGCLGQCAKGPVVVMYPQNRWFFEVTEDNIDEILTHIMQR